MTPEYWKLRGQFLSDADLAVHLLEKIAVLEKHIEQFELQERLNDAQKRRLSGEANGRNARDGRTRARNLSGAVRTAGQANRS